MTTQNMLLPKGFHDIHDNNLRIMQDISECHFTNGNLYGYTPLLTASVGYLENFSTGSSSLGEKGFEFKDRANRDLILTPDPTPAVIRHYNNLNLRNNLPYRTNFTSPVFRYRRNKYRQYTLIGYVIINEKERSDFDDLSLELAILGNKLLSQFGITHIIEVIDFSVYYNILEKCGLSQEDGKNILHTLRPMNITERIGWITDNISNKKYKKNLIDIIKLKPFDISKNNENTISNEIINKSILFSKSLSKHTNSKITVNFGNLHSSELHDGIAFRYKYSKGPLLGDGGSYSKYGNNLSKKIYSLKSIALGLEAIADESPYKTNDYKFDIIVINIDASFDFVSLVVKLLRDKGYSTVSRDLQRKLSKTISSYRNTFSNYIVIGENEERTRTITIRNMTTNAKETLTL